MMLIVLVKTIILKSSLESYYDSNEMQVKLKGWVALMILLKFEFNF